MHTLHKYTRKTRRKTHTWQVLTQGDTRQIRRGGQLVSRARPFFLTRAKGALKKGLVNYRYPFRSAVPKFWGPITELYVIPTY